MDEITIHDISTMDGDELRGARQRIAARLHDLLYDDTGATRNLDSRGPEQAEFDRLMALDSKAKAFIVARDALARGVRPVTAFGGLIDRSDPTLNLAPADVARMSGDQVRDKALRALETRGRDLAPQAQDQLDKLLRTRITEDSVNLDGSYIARRTLLTESDTYRSAWRRAVTETNPLLSTEEVAALRALKDLDRDEFRAMSDGSSAAGGYGLPVFIDPSIILTAQGSMAPIRQLARTEQITTNQWKGVSSAGVTWSFMTEGAVATDNAPTLAQPTVPAYMARGFVPFSIEVQSDYPNFAQEMAKLLAAGFDDLLAQKLMTGSGTNEPTGIVTALDADTTTEVRLTTAGSLGTADIDKHWEALADRWRANSSWLMSYGVGDQVAALSTVNAGSIAYASTDLTGVVTTLRTRPAHFSSYGFTAKVSGTTSQNAAIVGDFSNYLICIRAGLSVELVPMLFSQQTAGTGFSMPTAQRGWFAWGRVGGDAIVHGGFKLLNQT